MSGFILGEFPVPPVPYYITEAERLCWHLDGPAGDDRRWRRGIFPKFPDRFAIPLARQYIRRAMRPRADGRVIFICFICRSGFRTPRFL